MADTKISALTELETPADEDLLVVVDDPSGTPVTKRITKSNLLTSLGMELDYSEVTSNTTVTATTEGGADTVVTGNAVNYDGSTPILVTFFSNNMRPGTDAVNRNITIWLFDNGSSIGQMAYESHNINTENQNVPCHAVRRITPASGSHTFSVRASVNAGSGLVAAGAGGSGTTSPSFIRISKANP